MTFQETLGWTLIHFLWQGAGIGLVTMVAFRVARRPETRYVAGCVGLAAMGASAAGTFAYLWSGATTRGVIVAASTPTMLAAALPWVNRIWAIGAAALLARALGGWVLARRRTRTDIAPLNAGWMKRAAVLARRLGVDGRVRVFESAAVMVPMVFGWIRPVVLLPACVLTGMTVGQVEALLAHELAHVRRHDYLVNLIQTALESMLFYHPVVWWVSDRLRRERELCCDEIAVRVCGDRILYSEALLCLEETRVAIALAASGGSLRERIGRILGVNETKTGWTPAWLLGGALVVCMGVVWARTEQQPPPPPPPPPPTVEGVDSTPPTPAVPVKVRRNATVPPPPPPPPPPVKVYKGVSGGVSGGVVGGVSGGVVGGVAKGAPIAVDAGPRLVPEDEIERRMEYAEKKFAKDGVNGLLTDRGRTYVKMGPPDEIESHPGKGDQWLYRDGRRILAFDEAGKLKK